MYANAERVPYYIDFDSYREAIISKKILREYNIEVVAAGDGELPYRKTFFNYGFHYEELNRSDYFGFQDICFTFIAFGQ